MQTQPGAPYGVELPENDSSTKSSAKKTSLWLFGTVGLAVGLVAGMGIGLSSSSAADESAKNTAADAINTAVETCSVTESKGITIMDGGASIEMQTSGKKTWTGGAPFSDIECVLDELQAPQSIQARMGTTRALDGRQTGNWAGYAISWGYHPDNGLNVIVESQEQP